MTWPPGVSGNPSGRPKGSRNKRSQALADRARAAGLTPIEVLQQTVEHLMHRANNASDPEKSELMERASDIAAKLAPFVHAKLSAIQHTGAGGGPMEVRSDHVPDAVAERILAATGIDIRKPPEEMRH